MAGVSYFPIPVSFSYIIAQIHLKLIGMGLGIKWMGKVNANLLHKRGRSY
jgi:hypothetical protein